MNSIDIFPWDDNFNTGLPTVDEQHRKLVALLNALAGHVAFKSEALVLDRLLDELADYTVYHFTSEEAIWREYLSNSEHEVEHRKTHALFVQEVMRLRGELASRPMMDVAEEALGFLARWLYLIPAHNRGSYPVESVPEDVARERSQAQEVVAVETPKDLLQHGQANCEAMRRDGPPAAGRGD